MDRRTFVKCVGLGTAVLCGARALRAPAVWAKGPKFQWRMVTSWPPGMAILQTGAERFARRVGEMSEGRLTIKVFAGGELVPSLGVFDAVSQGTVECGHSASYYWAGKSVAAQWFTSVPFGLDAQGMNVWLYQGNGLKLWENLYADFNLVSRPAGNTGVQMGGWFNKEIRTLSDFEGLKMRIPGLGGKVLARAGATIVLLPAGEIYTALERGVIDATEWVGPAHDAKMGFQRVAKYYYGPGWHEPGSVLELMISRSAYSALPVALQQVVDAAAAELNIRMLAEFESQNSSAINQLKVENNVELRLFPEAVIDGLRALSHEALQEEASKDPAARRIHEDFVGFKKSFSLWSAMSEHAYYNRIIGI